MIKQALISVSDKTNIVEFAKKLQKFGISIISTGGTYDTLKDGGIPAIAIESYTGHPEIMDGRVKTLHPKIHGGILAVRDNEQHKQQMMDNRILPIDMIVVNLYPFEATINKQDATPEDIIENIDIGGPTLLRAGAKNYRYVSVVTDPSDYDKICTELSENKGDTTLKTRFELAVKVYTLTGHYDSVISKYLSENRQKFI